MKKRYWLRGGILGFSIGIVLWIYKYIYYVEPRCDFLVDYKFFTNYEVTLSGCNFLLKTDFYKSVFVLFVLGALFGWLYGKIKNRNLSPSNV